jgi:type IV pilus assembly protein PilF
MLFAPMTRKTAITLLVAMMGLAFTGCANTKKAGEADDPLQSGTATSGENQNRYRARLHTELGANYLQREQYVIALEQLSEAIRLDPTYGLAYSIAGLVHARLNEEAKAESSFRRAVEISPNEGDVRNQYGSFLCSTNRTKEGLEQFEAALRIPLYQAQHAALENAGSCALSANMIKPAEAYFTRLVQTQPFSSRGYQGLAAIALKTSQWDEVKKQVESGLRTQQVTPQLLFYGVCAERKIGSAAAAETYRNQLKQRFADSPFVEAIDRGGCE